MTVKEKKGCNKAHVKFFCGAFLVRKATEVKGK